VAAENRAKELAPLYEKIYGKNSSVDKIEELTVNVSETLPTAQSFRSKVLDRFSLPNSPITGENLISLNTPTPNLLTTKLSPLNNLDLMAPATPIGTTDPFSDL